MEIQQAVCMTSVHTTHYFCVSSSPQNCLSSFVQV